MSASESDLRTPLEERPQAQVPDHALIRQIGSGAYGEVWLAKNIVGTYRAVKVVYRNSFKDSRPYEREYRGIQKFEPLSRSNDGFVDILQIGRNDDHGYFYYVMELADTVGESRHTGNNETDPKGNFLDQNYSPKTLRSEIEQRGRLAFDECLPVAMSLTLALGHLHRHGLIHRDIKPSNIIFVGGIPKLADIGLVTEVDEARSFVGTEGFIAPEGPNSPQADLYSLGKVLYEMSMGKDRMDFPEPFTDLGQAEDSHGLEELNVVIVKACATHRRDRYQTAEEMHIDLALLQSGKSVKSKRMLERRLALASKAASLVGLVAALATGGYLYQRRQTLEAIRLQQLAQTLAAQMQIQNAENLFQRGHSSLALAHLARVLREHPNNRVAAERILAALNQRRFPRLAGKPLVHPVKLQILGSHQPAHLSPDGQRIVTVSEDHAVRLWSAQTGQEIAPAHRHNATVYSAQFSPDGTKLVTASADRTVCVLDALVGGPIFPPLQHDRSVLHATFSPDGACIATASKDGRARVFDARNGELLCGPLVHVGPVNAVAFSPDSQRLATAMEGGRVRIWDLSSGQEKHRFRLEGPVRLLAFSPDGKWLAAGVRNESGEVANGDWSLRLWDLEVEPPQTSFKLHQNHIYSLAFSPDSQRIVTSDSENVARVWRVRTGEELFQLRHSSLVYSAAFSPNGQQILTASVDHTARLWDAKTGEPIAEAMLHDARVIHAEFDRDGSHVLTIGWEDKTVKLWDTGSVPASAKVLPHSHWVRSAEFGPRDQDVITTTAGSVITASDDNVWDFGGPEFVAVWDAETVISKTAPPLPQRAEVVAARWTQAGPKALISERVGKNEFSNLGQFLDLQTGKAVGAQFQTTQRITCAHFSPDGLKAATGCEDGTFLVWDARQGVALGSPFANGSRLRSVRFNADGAKLVAATDGGVAILWDIASGQRIGEPLQHKAPVWFAQFSPQGDRVVTASLDYTAQIWSSNGSLISTLQHRAPVEYAEFSPDGTQVATASGSEARLWNAATGRQLTEPLQHSELVTTVCFSGDGLRVITASKDRTAQLWDARTGLKLADPFRHRDWVVSARFGRDASRAITASLDGTACIWDLHIALTPTPSWLPELAESVAGQRLTAARIPEPVSFSESADFFAGLSKQLGSESRIQWVRRYLAGEGR